MNVDDDDDNDDDDVCVLNVQASCTLIMTVALRTGRLQRCKCLRGTKSMSYSDPPALQVIYTTYKYFWTTYRMLNTILVCHTEHDYSK